MARTDLHSGKKKETASSIASTFYDKHAKELNDPKFGKDLPTIEPYTIMNPDGDPLNKPASVSASESFTPTFPTPHQSSVDTDGSLGPITGFRSSSLEAGRKESTKTMKKSPARLASVNLMDLTSDSGFQSSSPSALKDYRATKEAENRLKMSSDSTGVAKPKKAAPTAVWPSMGPARKSKLLQSVQPDFSGPVVRPNRPFVLRTTLANEIPPELDNHHLYVDHTGYPYDCKLVRIDPRINANERYILKIYESHTTPHTYALHQRYANIRKTPSSEIVVPIGSEFATAFSKLREIFQAKTGKKWEDRMAAGLMVIEEEECADDGGRPFMFLQPEPCEPAGQMPWKTERKAATAGVTMMGTSGIVLPPNVVREN
jgi:hypothetical protein